ncbi:MAG TPA: hypothetical protein VLM85_10420, partial [Polyangiaceae bacterium]|nr:hypothetical protein [Polyangiaceae bacterium]
MLRRLIGATFLGATILATSLPATAQNAPAPPDAATAVKNVQDFYDRTTTFSSDFQQNYLAKAYNQTKTSKG